MFPSGPGPDTIKLSGGASGTTTFLYSGANGSLVIELYDFSELAQEFFGNDVAIRICIAAEYKSRIGQLLDDGWAAQGEHTDQALFFLLRARLSEYFEVKDWLERNHIPYRHDFDTWA